MSLDMSTATRRPQTLTDRQREILQAAIELITRDGYGALTMRALARESGLKLGALQYHFRTTDDLLLGLSTHLSETYRNAFAARLSTRAAASLRDTVRFFFQDPVDPALRSERLWPQLWAMAKVQPVMRAVLDEIHAGYLNALEITLMRAEIPQARAHALTLMAAIEGSVLFVGAEAPWPDDAASVQDVILTWVDMLEARSR